MSGKICSGKSCGRGLVLGAILALAAGGIARTIYLYPPDQFSFYPRCMFNAMTGLECPSCGGLRAAHELLHGHFMAALALNPLLVIGGPVLLLAGCIRFWAWVSGRPWCFIPKNPVWIWVLLAGIGLFGVGRNLLRFFP